MSHHEYPMDPELFDALPPDSIPSSATFVDNPGTTLQPSGVHQPPTKTGDDQDIDNRRYHLNKAMGVDPSCRLAVQARRYEVSKHLELNFQIQLDRVYAQWSQKEWNRALNGTYAEFRKRYGWSKHVCEMVLKSICSDTARNRNSKIKKQQTRAQASASSITKINSVPQKHEGLGGRTTKRKFYLRRPNRPKQSDKATSNTAAQHHAEPECPSPSIQSSAEDAVPTGEPTAPPHERFSKKDDMTTTETAITSKTLLLESLGKLIVSPTITWVQFQLLMRPHLPINNDQCYLVKPADKRDVQWRVLAFPDELPRVLSCSDNLLFRRAPLSWINEAENHHDNNYEGFQNLQLLPETPTAPQLASEPAGAADPPKRKRGRPARQTCQARKSQTIVEGVTGELLVAEEIANVSQDITSSQHRTLRGRVIKKQN
ncbi:hypothetical protein BZA77DRAFT_357858 [Pyronema omphalodes]|nr:hypothetical protein BZA77DRAFT_357858 [Pyronema omphalodes]